MPQRSSSAIAVAIAVCRAVWGAPGNRQRRRLDDDGRSAPARHELLQRTAGERVAHRIAHGAGDVDDLRRLRRRAQHDVLVADRDEGDARAGEQWNAAHGWGQAKA